MKLITNIVFCLFIINSAHGQNSTIKVNPDGTHTVIHNHGNTSTQVNPNGTHTIIHHHGNTSTQVNPNGTHTIIHHHGNTSTQVNPDGTHTVTHHNGNTSTQVNPDGTHTVTHHNGNNANQVNLNTTTTTFHAKVSKRKRKKILALNRAMEQGIIKNNPIEIAKIYADDAYVINPRGIEAQGREAINAYWLGMKDRAPDWRLENHLMTTSLSAITQSKEWNNLEEKPPLPSDFGIDLSIEKDLIYQLGTSHLSFINKDTGDIRVSVVDFLIVWRKVGSTYEVFVDTYS